MNPTLLQNEWQRIVDAVSARGKQFSSPEMQESARKLYFLGAMSVFRKLVAIGALPPNRQDEYMTALREEFAGFDEDMNVVLAKSLRGEQEWDGGMLSDSRD